MNEVRETPAAMLVQTLERGWQFKQLDSDAWMPVARVPTNVHLDLIDNKIIEDPFLGYDELDCEWVGTKAWVYRTVVRTPKPAAELNGVKSELVLDGLDTYATVKLNEKIILQSDNMFIMHRVDVTSELEYDYDNVLEIEFRSALIESREIKDANPQHKWVGYNGDMARLAARKAQYHYGWDWGPVLITCGPWRAVRLETFSARISDLRIDYELNPILNQVSGSITATIDGSAGKTVLFVARLFDIETFTARADVDQNGIATVDFLIIQPKLWWPHGYGQQYLYTVTAIVTDGEDGLHSLSKQIGFRKSELVQKHNSIGKSFYFRINGVDIFCAGSNWIPGDSFSPRISKAKYRKWLQLVVDGNQTMVRIWGGGIWEEDAFYDTCDELGILVWQDFMFACGNYPASQEFLRSVELECVCQTQRLRHHPSLVVYAGNNEDYQIQEQFGLQYDYADKDPQSWLKTDFPARYIYEKLLPEIVATQAQQVAYHPGSPWGGGRHTSDPTIGDLHQWNVWHGTQEKYQIFDELGGRFNSEFGLEAFPCEETVRSFITDPSQLYPQSQMMDFHNKAAGHERRLATYLVENFRMETDLRKYIHLTQLSQAEAMTYAYRGWRRQWGQKRRCGGALVWQLNDCWPVISWSIVDYFLRKKPAYYAMRRALAPIAVAVKRAHHDWSIDHARLGKTREYECWVSSSLTLNKLATIELRYVSIATGRDIRDACVVQDVHIVANGTTEILRGTIDNTCDEPHVLAARIWVDGKIVSRDADWPQPLKYLEFSDRCIDVAVEDSEVRVNTSKPVKALVFDERDDVVLGDNGLDIMPGDERVISISGATSAHQALQWNYLGMP